MAWGPDLPRLRGHPFEERDSNGALAWAKASAELATEAYVYLRQSLSQFAPDISFSGTDECDSTDDRPSCGMPIFSEERGERPVVLVMRTTSTRSSVPREMATSSRPHHRGWIVLSACVCALMLSSCGSSARALGSTGEFGRARSTSACEHYVYTQASELLSGVIQRGYKGAVTDEGVEGTWYQNEVAQLTQEVDVRYHLGSKESDAWNHVLHAYLSGPELRALANRVMVKSNDRAVKSNIRRWCAGD